MATTPTVLYLSQQKPPKTKPKGVYTRPSAAIERGSGFYIPGLEGSRVRLIFGCMVLILNYVNGFFSNESDIFALSQTVAVIYGILLILLGGVEMGKEMGFVASPTTSGIEANSSFDYKKDVSRMVAAGSLIPEALERLDWITATFVSLTPATNVMVLKNDEVVFRLGAQDQTKDGLESYGKEACAACRDAVFNSKGGRVAIPDDHPGATILPEEARRCILLQSFHSKNGEKCCIVVGSGDVLQAYTKNDLKWLGVLGRAGSLSNI